MGMTFTQIIRTLALPLAMVVAGTGFGCATATVASLPTPTITAPETSDAGAACQLTGPEIELLNTKWRRLKRHQTGGAASWTLDAKEMAKLLDLSPDSKRRRALERLYQGRFGNMVFFRDGLPTGAGVRAQILLRKLESGESEALGRPSVSRLDERVKGLRKLVDNGIERPLSDDDLDRICGHASVTHGLADLDLDVLTVESLHGLADLEVLQTDLRRAVAELDATLVLVAWDLGEIVSDDSESPDRLQMPTWLLHASRRTDDVDALSKAVYAALKYDGFKKPYAQVGPIIRKVILAAEDSGIDPLVMVTLVFMESRFRPGAIGDGGRACGLAQQHPDFSMKWGLSDTLARYEGIRIPEARRQRQFNYECNLLKDPDYALKVLVHLLHKIQERAPNLRVSVCRYNEGPYAPCEGRGLFYLRKHEWWRELIRVAYERILSKQEQKAECDSADPGTNDS